MPYLALVSLTHHPSYMVLSAAWCKQHILTCMSTTAFTFQNPHSSNRRPNSTAKRAAAIHPKHSEHFGRAEHCWPPAARLGVTTVPASLWILADPVCDVIRELQLN